MKTIAIRVAALGALVLVLQFGPIARCHAEGAEEVAPGLKVGDVLDQTNYQAAKDLLPPEILRHYERGEYRNRIIACPTGKMRWEKSFDEATEKNASRLDVDDRGTIIDRTTGKQPDYYYGLPFPKIDPNDPKAAVKVVWNNFLAYWYGGNSFNRTLVAMLVPKGVERRIVANGWFNFLDGQSTKYRQPNPNNLQSEFLGVSQTPADLQGTASLSWRYRDPGKRDSVWAFVPALRRVRAVSPANRSDGYLGSDISGDDGFSFDGKPEDFDWKLVGLRDGMRLVDAATFSDQIKIQPAAGGGWSTLMDNNPPVAGFEVPDWKGVSWAPAGLQLCKRRMWVVEAVPHDKYYLYGRLEIWVDAESWSGVWNRKFSWNGELINTYQLAFWINHPAGPPDNPELMPAGTMAYACAENVKVNRATVSGLRADPQAPYFRRVPVEEHLFDPQALQRFGK